MDSANNPNFVVLSHSNARSSVCAKAHFPYSSAVCSKQYLKKRSYTSITERTWNLRCNNDCHICQSELVRTRSEVLNNSFIECYHGYSLPYSWIINECLHNISQLMPQPMHISWVSNMTTDLLDNPISNFCSLTPYNQANSQL